GRSGFLPAEELRNALVWHVHLHTLYNVELADEGMHVVNGENVIHEPPPALPDPSFRSGHTVRPDRLFARPCSPQSRVVFLRPAVAPGASPRCDPKGT